MIIQPTPTAVDVSEYQGHPNWKKANQSIVHFRGKTYRLTNGIAKVDQGSYTDPDFCYNWKQMKKVGIQRGAYSFIMWHGDGTKDARHFVRTILKCGVVMTSDYLWLDAEQNGKGSQKANRQYLLTFMSTVHNLTHLDNSHIGIYSGKYYFEGAVGSGKPFAKRGYKSWVAAYTSAPLKINGWPRLAWQASDNVFVPGVGHSDFSLFK